ncbi:MAG: L,D-transpeptidase, partial [Bradyrhizobium sp.]|nr:L,D-transpeptidase [Bradyrhizobium sp.]
EQAEAEKLEPAKTETVNAETSKPESVKAEFAKVEATEVAKKPDMAATATTSAQPAAADAKKDQTRLAEPAPAARPKPPKRAGQIAVFISRKDSKIYVRQNFAPLFDAPVTIAPSDRPLGTHVFTAEVDKTDSNALRWSVVSLPVSVRSVGRENEGRHTRRQRMAGAIPVAAKPAITPDSPAEALDRITVPADAMARINEMLTSGGSIIVSDQGINQGETGEGTDFIVRLR